MTIQPRAELAAIRAYVPGKPAPDIPGALKLASHHPIGTRPTEKEVTARWPEPGRRGPLSLVFPGNN